ncbi:MAG TPA: trypsin-like peptidase domain-containing protein [Candidatus Saccharimonadales bacterium]|nr:trypsin-like peptidase domain-containing protein [Candidatus Saccharimonadales bacterium]
MEKQYELGIASRLGLSAAALTGALVLTACGSGESTPQNTDTYHPEDIASAPINPAPEASPSKSETPVAVDPPTAAEVLANPDLLAESYPILPTTVEKIVDAAVQIEADATQVVEYYDRKGNLVNTGSEFAFADKAKAIYAGGGGSGSVVKTSAGKQVILTGAHVVAPNEAACAETTVNLQATDTTGKESLVSYKQAMEHGGDPLDSVAEAPDKGVIITQPGQDRTFIPLLPKVSLDPGEVLFTANYEPTAEGNIRSPQNRDELQDPAIYNMMVLGEDATSGLIAVLERGKSYGTMEENRSRKGASGGAVVNPNGELVATIEAGMHDDATLKEVEFELAMIAMHNDNPAIRNIEVKKSDSIHYLQPITQSDVDKLAAKAEQSEPCKERPIKRVTVSE